MRTNSATAAHAGAASMDTLENKIKMLIPVFEAGK